MSHRCDPILETEASNVDDVIYDVSLRIDLFPFAEVIQQDTWNYPLQNHYKIVQSSNDSIHISIVIP